MINVSVALQSVSVYCVLIKHKDIFQHAVEVVFTVLYTTGLSLVLIKVLLIVHLSFIEVGQI